MKQTVQYNKTLTAYRVENENDLDELLTEEFGEHTTIYKTGNKIRISASGNDVSPAKFEFGDWVIRINNETIETYTDDEFNKYFKVVV